MDWLIIVAQSVRIEIKITASNARLEKTCNNVFATEVRAAFAAFFPTDTRSVTRK